MVCLVWLRVIAEVLFVYMVYIDRVAEPPAEADLSGGGRAPRPKTGPLSRRVAEPPVRRRALWDNING